MMVALILAQLVLPWPGLDSPRVQPGPTICVGECAGPVVWGPAERGRLVVACDMRSDTCSDGRKITTTRPTPVPCEVAPGQWEMVPENTGCYSVRGLESWASNTSYLAYGAELDRSPWSVWPPDGSGSIVEKLPGEGYRVCHIGTASNAGVSQTYPAVEGDPLSFAAIARPHTAPSMLMLATSNISDGGTVNFNTTGWGTYAVAGQFNSGETSRVYIYPRPGGQQLCIDLLAAWLTKTSTPGRACWGGEAPVTCSADRHTISTEGWPTESGEISLVYTPQGAGIGSSMYLAATTAGGTGQPSGFYLYRISATGALVFGLRRGDTISAQATQNLAWENGRSYHVRVRWSPERAEIWRDGVRLRSWVPTTVPDSHPDVVHIGTARLGGDPAQGSIRSLTVRSYEEVSP